MSRNHDIRGSGDTRDSHGTDGTRGTRDSRGTDGTRGTNRTRGTRGRTSPQASRRPSHDSSPAQSDAGTLEKYTSAFGRVIYRGGHGGSSSRTGTGDMHGIIRHHTSLEHLQSATEDEDHAYRHESDNDTDDGDNTHLDTSQRDSIYEGGATGTSQKKYISRVGDKFGSFEVHKSICDILREHLDGPWNTFRKVPKSVRVNMYERFRTCWSWDSESDHNTYDGFLNVLKARYSDIMLKFKIQSSKRARNAGHDIGPKDYKQFSIIRDFPPDLIPGDVWHRLCDKRAFGKEPSYKEVYLYTHLTKDSKAKLLAKELDLVNLEEMEFCTDRARQAYKNYLQEMVVVHGSNSTEDDPDVWLRLQAAGRKRRVFGIGSSDVNYVVTGTPSSSCGVTQSFDEHRRSQEKIRSLEIQMEDERRQREEMKQQMDQQWEKQMEQQKRFEEFMKNFRPQGD